MIEAVIIGAVVVAICIIVLFVRARMAEFAARADARADGLDASLAELLRITEEMSEGQPSRAVAASVAATDYRQVVQVELLMRSVDAVLWAFEPMTGRVVYSRGGGVTHFDVTDDERVGHSLYLRPDGSDYARIADELVAGSPPIVAQQIGDNNQPAITSYGAVRRSDGSVRYIAAVTIPIPEGGV